MLTRQSMILRSDKSSRFNPKPIKSTFKMIRDWSIDARHMSKESE